MCLTRPFKEPICEGLDDVYHSHKAPGPACTYSASVGYYTSHNCSTSKYPHSNTGNKVSCGLNMLLCQLACRHID
jgi:hypothetical protein